MASSFQVSDGSVWSLDHRALRPPTISRRRRLNNLGRLLLWIDILHKIKRVMIAIIVDMARCKFVKDHI